MIKMFKLRKSGRVCYPFPWESKALPCPWPATHERVMIPLTSDERRNSKKLAHTQIVRRSRLEDVKESRLTLQRA